MKERLDKVMVDRALAPSREKAQALIMAGYVRVNGDPAIKAGVKVDPDVELEVVGKDHPYVSRGGVKLEAALKEFGVNPTGWVVLDIGASTGGFTHCLLLHGAARVFAVDVGYGQLAWKVRSDPRVTVLERTNIRQLRPETLGAPVDLAVIDVSFIALALVLQHAHTFLRNGGYVLGLVKPQFEAGREQVGKGGRVSDPQVHEQVLQQVEAAGAAVGLTMLRQMPSPIVGKKSGNQEYLVLWQKSAVKAAPATEP